MPDGYGDDLPSWYLAIRSPIVDGGSHNDPAYDAVARLCLHLKIGKRDTLKILGATQNRENFEWLDNLSL